MNTAPRHCRARPGNPCGQHASEIRRQASLAALQHGPPGQPGGDERKGCAVLLSR